MEPLEGLIASAALFLSVTSIVLALSKDMYGGRYVDKLKMQDFVYDHQTPRADRLRSWLVMFPLVLVASYIIATIAVFVAMHDGSSTLMSTLEYTIHGLEILGLLFVLNLARESVLVLRERARP